MSFRRNFLCGVATVLASPVLVACGADAPQRSSSVLSEIVGRSHPAQDDTFQVFVCAVPLDSTDPNFGDLPLRLSLQPASVAELMQQHVRPYFDRLSHGLYRPDFVPGAILTMATDETHDECVERAIDASSDDADAVMVVANAEHVATAPGGWGRPGAVCEAGDCPASQTGRALYVGASDFHPDWGPVPLLDLIEHEIGHTLGLPHSGDGVQREDQHASALDVMSNSAAPREMQEAALGAGADPTTLIKDAQDTLAIDRLALGWLPIDDVAVLDTDGGRFELSPSTGDDGLRLLILPIDDSTFLTVEFLAADGLDAFLPESGIAVHRIEQAPAACGRDAADTRACTGIDRVQVTLGSTAPHIDLLDAAEGAWDLDGWTISVTAVGDTAQVEVRPTER